MAILDAFRKFSLEQKLAFVALSYGYITMFCPGVLVAPFFPAEAAKQEVGSKLTGIVFAVQALVGVVCGPFVGMAIAKFGPKTCFLVGIALNATFSTTFGLLEHSPSKDWFIAGSFICLGFAALGGSIIYTATLTFAAKMFPENLSLIIGTTETYIAIAEVIGLSTGGILHDLGGFKLPFILFGLLHMLSIPVDIFMLPPDDQRKKSVMRTSESSPLDGEKSNKTKELETTEDVKSTENNIRPWHLLKIPRTLIMSMVVLTTGICWSFLSSTLERHLEPLELTSSQVTSMFLITAVGYGIASPLGGFIADKMERTWTLMTSGMIIGGAAFYFLGPLPIFGLGNTIWLNIISLVVITFALAAASIPACEACLLYTLEAGHPDGVATYAIVSSLIATTYSAGAAIGAFSAGYLVEEIGYPNTAALFGSILLGYGVMVLCYFLFCYKPPRRSNKRESGESFRRSVRLQSLTVSLSQPNIPAALAQELNAGKSKNEDDIKHSLSAPLNSVVTNN